MSITFQLEVGSGVEPLNFSNPNAAALMALAGLASEVDGEVRGEQLRACVQRLLQINRVSAGALAPLRRCDTPGF